MWGRVQIGKKLLLPLFILIAAIGLFIVPEYPVRANSNSFGVSPATIYNTVLKAGSVYKKEIIISRSDPSDLAVANISVEGKEIKDWIVFQPANQISLPIGKTRVPFTTVIKIPEDASIGIYEGLIKVTMSKMNSTGQVTLLPSVALKVKVSVVDEDIPDLRILNVKALDIYSNQEAKMEMRASNTGNAATKPSKMFIQFLDVSGEDYSNFDVTEFQDVPSFSEESQLVTVKGSSFEVGTYFANVAVYNEVFDVIYEDKLSFNVYQGEGDGPESKSSGQSIDYVKLGLILAGVILLIFIIILLKRRRKEEEEEGVRK